MIGQFAYSKAGHDKTQLYVIVAQEGDFVYLSDGRLKPLEKPKRKRRKHIQITKTTVEDSLCRRLEAGEPVRNEEIKYAIKLFFSKPNKLEE